MITQLVTYMYNKLYIQIVQYKTVTGAGIFNRGGGEGAILRISAGPPGQVILH